MKKEKNVTKTYRFSRPIINVFTKLFLHPKYIGLENIPKDGPIILAGTHTHLMDCILLVSSTKRCIHFFAKKELWEGKAGFYFKNMGMISVDRKIKDHSAIPKALEYLKDGNVIGIFPEGTTEKEFGKMLPFKIGAVKMAKESGVKIVPFAIKACYKPFKGRLTIKFDKPYSVKSDDLEKENELLFNKVSNLRNNL